MAGVAEDAFPYALVLAASAPFAVQLGLGGVPGLLLFLLFAFPALSLLIALSRLSKAGPLLSYQRLAPIASGVPWALAWIAGERVLSESLRGAQTIVYALFSLRLHLDWALDCGHSYNTPLCVPFLSDNETHSSTHRYPDNFWAAQQFNRYAIRGNDMSWEKTTRGWEPNEWYLGPAGASFSLQLPSFPLFIAHLILWTLIAFLLVKLNDRLSWFLTHVCVVAPLLIYFFIVLALTFLSLKFNLSHAVEDDVPEEKIEEDPMDFWSDLKGIFRTSTVAIDYSSAFTGIILLACSQVQQGSPQISVPVLLFLMSIAPTLLGILTRGCEGHLAEVQPAYRIYPSTDETITLDLLPVCLATSPGGPLWAFLFYVAHFLYSSLAPMLTLLLLLQNIISEQFLSIPPQRVFGSLFAVFALISVPLYMPMGTRLITFFRYVSQSAFVHLFAFATIFLVYGWQSLERDLRGAGEVANESFISYLFSVSGPISSFLLFSFVPMLLTSKFVAVYDLLKSGKDVVKHIDLGIAALIPGPVLLKRVAGTVFSLVPQLVVWGSAAWMTGREVAAHHPLSNLLKPSSQFLHHTTLFPQESSPRSLAHRFFDRFIGDPCYRTSLLLIFIAECFMCLIVWWLFVKNAILVNVTELHYGVANIYRSFVLLLIAIAHSLCLWSMRSTLQTWTEHERLRSYIALATVETAFLNGYMWMFAWDHSWGVDLPPLVFIFLNSFIRGTCIFTAIAICAQLAEENRMPRPRDATEMDEPDMRVNENDPEDDTPIIFELA